MTQEVAVAKVEQQVPPVIIDAKQEKKKDPSVQEIVDSLKSIADDIGQISELSSEEKILVSQFFNSFLKLMQPLAPSIAVSETAIPQQLGDVAKAYVDTTGNLVLQFQDGHLELKNLSDPKNRDLMTTIISDILPKFKTLTSNQKRKIENRIKLLTSVTKEIQKSSEALFAVYNTEK